MKSIFSTAALFGSLATILHAGPLTEARVTKIVNQVSVVDPASGPRKAELQSLIKDQIGLQTGIKSRSEVVFQDHTLTRIGPESYFSFKAGTRDMSLEKGTMLLQVPKGLGGARIRTAAVTAAITGTTVMLEHIPGKNLKVLVLEGSLRLSVNGKFGDSLLLLPGKMVIMPPNAQRIPEPVAVDLGKIVKTSALIKMGQGAALPSMPLIEQEIAMQTQLKEGNSLLDTNLVILGGGSDVVLAGDDVLATLNKRDVVTDQLFVAKSTPTPIPAAAPSATPVAAATSGTPPAVPAPFPTAAPSASPSMTAAPPAIPATPAPSATPAIPAPSAPPAIPAPSATPAATPLPTATPSPTPRPVDTDDDDDGDDEGDYDEKLDLGDSDNPKDKVTVDQPIDLSTGGRTGKVNIHAKGAVKLNSMIKVSESQGAQPSRSGGRISVKSNSKESVAIAVTSSAQLLSLLDAAGSGRGGSIKFESAGGAVNVDGATLQADRGTIEIKNKGEMGAITLKGANLRAETIKVSALGKEGQLNIGGGTISADTALELFAGGSNGTITFTDNVTLNGASVKTISGDTVMVRDGKVVTIGGPAPARVFTNHPNYSGSGGNNSTTGAFGGNGATTQPLKAGPGG